MKRKLMSIMLALSMLISIVSVNVAADTTAVAKFPDEINFIVTHQKTGEGKSSPATELHLSWTNPDYNAASITVTEPTLGTVSDGTNLDLTAGAKNYIHVTGLTSGTIYTFTVTITDAEGNAYAYTNTGRAMALPVEQRTEDLYNGEYNFYYGSSTKAGRYLDSAVKAVGDYSMKFVSNVPNSDSYVYLTAESGNIRTLNEGYTYEFSFWSKNELKDGGVYWRDDWDGTFNASSSSEWTKNTYSITDVVFTDDGGATYKVTNQWGQTVENTSKDQKFKARIIIKGAGKAWIDDIKFYETDTAGTKSGNKITYGGFEWNDYYNGARSIFATGGANSATISWTNPKWSSYTTSTFTPTVTEAVIVDENLNVVKTGDTTAEKWQSFTISGLENNKLYKYYIKIIGNGVTHYIPVPVITNSLMLNDGSALQGWTVEKYGNFMKTSSNSSRVIMDTAEKHSGEAALRVHGNSNSGQSAYMKRIISGLDANKKYKVGLWVKSPTKTSGSFYLQNEGDTKYLNGVNLWTAGYEDWTYLETEEITPLASGSIVLRFNIADIAGGSIWIDDMSLVEVDGDGTNLMPDGGFEDVVKGIRDVDISYSVSGSSFDATISWTNPNNTHISRAYIVDADGNTVAEADSTAANDTASCNVTGLTMGEELEYKIVVAMEHNDSWTDIVPAINFEEPVVLSYQAVAKFPDEINFIVTHHRTTDSTSSSPTELHLSWTNPDYDAASITVTEPTLGTVSDGTGLDLTAGAKNYIKVENLTKGTIYTFTVTITDAEGKAYVYANTGRAYSIPTDQRTEDLYNGETTFYYGGNPSAGRYLDSAVKAVGDYSMKFVSNMPNSDSFVYLTAEREKSPANIIALNEGYTYEFSFWSKNELKNGGLYWMDDWDGTFNASSSSEWTKNTYTITDVVFTDDGGATYNVTNQWGQTVENTSRDQKFKARITMKGAGKAWIDDIQLYETDTEGTKSENKITHGGFEWGDDYRGARNINVKEGENSATISWSNPTWTTWVTNNMAPAITEAVIVDENLKVVATGNTTAGGSNSITINGLENNKLYTYYIKIIASGVTQYIPVSVTPTALKIFYSADVTEPVENYFKMQGDIYYSGEEEIVLEAEGAEGKKSIVTLSPKTLSLGLSNTALSLSHGWYNIKIKFDYLGKLAIITVTTPEGEVIQRTDPKYLTGLQNISKINIKREEEVENSEDIVKNIKINTFDESDLPTELSRRDINIYEADTVINDWDKVSVNADKILIDMNTPFIDKALIDKAVSVKGAVIASTEYENDVYVINLSETLTPDTVYEICTDSSLTGENKSFKFTTEPAVYAEITGISKDGTSISEIAELSDGDTVSVAVDYTDVNGTDEGYLVYAAEYDTYGKLVNAQVSDGADNCEFTFDELTGVNEIKFFVWTSSQKPLADEYILPLNTFEEDEVYNLVTTFYGDEGTTRGFAWTALPEYTDMVIQYAEDDVLWTGNNVSEAAVYTEYESLLYYKADIDGLEPGETYVYRVGDTVDNVWSDFYTFTTEPENVTEFSFVGFTDPQSGGWSGGYEYMKYTLDEAMKNSPDAAFMVSLGDLTDTGSNESHWHNYFKAAQGYAESLPHMAVLGNHEVYKVPELAGKYFSLHFNNPKNGADALGDLTVDDVQKEYTKALINNFEGTAYSFDYGNAHFAVINTGPEMENDSYIMLEKEKEWLKADLNASDKKWKIVMLHQGLYPAKTDRADSGKALADVIDECGVDLVLSGHDHIVTRTYPIKNGQIVTRENPEYVTKGSGTVHAILGSSGPKRYSTVVKTPNYAAVLNATAYNLPSYSVFNVTSDKIEVVTKQITGEVVDKFVIAE